MRVYPCASALVLAAALPAVPALAQDNAAASVEMPADHAAMDHETMDHGTMDHEAMDHGAEPVPPGEGMDHSMHMSHGTAQPASSADTPGNAPPPPVSTDLAAERYYPRAVIEGSLAATLKSMRFRGYAVQIDELEYRARDGSDGYGFAGQAWYGGDIDRAVFAFEGEGNFGEQAERLELSGYWRHAIDPWFNLQLGMRQDLAPDPQRTYAMAGIEGLAPYWIEVQAQMFVSDKGDVHGRLTASYDQRITNRLILEPELEANAAFQDVPELGIGSGMDKLELSARLRYEVTGMFAPYVGVFWERRFGKSADYARSDGEGASHVSALAGVRMIF
ncbi:copper resistance protein B [Novosphingobium album (ex Hu et al. 2023)]|uniref:Copper resistance protein B n=1 Tax=Novosphingobium album (ex Hu et al. 2023) TaxID=2930093 RepID=A0ABT0B7A8_9SPHN|nr:copper resistance protein B [Novosphingobium album (ex Hu et al. 2023)]MCJ2180926.1 copper resistance protein B [Novosphingobium album (ex Hu et al. 2023)]